jgi:hypothetical protein
MYLIFLLSFSSLNFETQSGEMETLFCIASACVPAGTCVFRLEALGGGRRVGTRRWDGGRKEGLTLIETMRNEC